jgi:hypothetical protein
MEKEFVPYEQAFALKDLGFKEPCLEYYSTPNHPSLKPFILLGINPSEPLMSSQMYKIGIWKIKAPLYQQAFSFFREKYELDGWVVPYLKLNGSKVYSYIIDGADYDEEDCELNTHEEAELECIKKLIEISKNK